MTQKTRRKIIAGNWKMYKTGREAKDFVQQLLPLIEENKHPIYLAVPFTAIHSAADAARGSAISIGAQNMNDKEEGPYTGEISGAMLKEAGATFVILGHSERRYIFGEGNRFINAKLRKGIEIGLQIILCIGETEHERSRGMAEAALTDQFSHCFDAVSEQEVGNAVLAYEPVWAIGTGKTATPQQAQEMHAFCRGLLAKKYGKQVAEQISILYGGSVKPDNTRSLLEQPDIDGVLVGGGSLSVDSFSRIANAAQPSSKVGF